MSSFITSSSSVTENDKKRLRNQFSKDERLHFLNIMSQFAPLLDNKNVSIVGRKEIWDKILRKFHDAGFHSRTSAQLKKYWQNYKYHTKRINNPKMLISNSTSSTQRVSEVTELASGSDVECKIQENSKSKNLKPSLEFCATQFQQNIQRSRAGEISQDYSQTVMFEGRKVSSSSSTTSNISYDDEGEEDEEEEENEGDENLSIWRKYGKSFRNKSTDFFIPVKDFDDGKTEDKITDIVVSSSKVSGNSVTVSLIYPNAKICERDFETHQRIPKRRKTEKGDNDTSKIIDDNFLSFDNPISKQPPSISSQLLTDFANRTKCFLLQPRNILNESEIVHEENDFPSKMTVIASPKKNAHFMQIDANVPKNREFLVENLKVEKNEEENSFPESRNDEDLRCNENIFENVVIFRNNENEEGDNSNNKNNNREKEEKEKTKEGNVERGGKCKIGNEVEIQKSHESQFDETLVYENDPFHGNNRNNNSHFDNSNLNFRSTLHESLEINHQLLLHRLEAEEKRLKIKIAEMTVQEIRLKIRALNEERLRAKEMHELRLALIINQGVKSNPK